MCSFVDKFTNDSERDVKPDVARWKQALQSSTISVEQGAVYAVDVNRDTCSMTRFTRDAWWQVDLEAIYVIEAVVITTPIPGEALLGNID